ncbi:MAG: hypothetical protein KDD58_09575 [Bdellovibrionales bacterium]|nr:hypothetical protein [Bdellovibrionales bacterium]
MAVKALLTFLIISYVFMGLAYAQEADTQTKLPKESIVQKTHEALSKGVFSLSRRLDSILGAESVEDEKSTSSVKLSYSSIFLERDNPSYLFKIKSRLVLPKTEKRFQLVLHNLRDEVSEDRVKTAEEETLGAEQDPKKTVKESDFSAALRYVHTEQKKFRIHTDGGVKFKIPLDPFVKLRARENIELSASELEFKQGAEWFKSSGVAIGGSISYLKKLNHSLFFSQPNVARWTEELKITEFQNGVSFTQLLPSERSLSYYFSASGLNKPAVAVHSYTLGITFRTWMAWRWLIFEVTPFGFWARNKNFTFQPGFVTRLEMTVGHF